MNNRRSLLPLAVLLLILVSCRLPGSEPASPAAPPADAVATAVAATLAAAPTSVPNTPTPMLPTSTVTSGSAGVEPTATIPAPVVHRALYIDPTGDLWVWEEGRGAYRDVDTRDVREAHFSPDGSWIVYVRAADDRTSSLWVMRSDGTGARLLLSSDGFLALPRPEGALTSAPIQLTWLPNTHIIAMGTRPVYDGLGLVRNEDLHLFNADTGAYSQLYAAGKGGAFFFSPDGKRVALVHTTSIDLANMDGSSRLDGVITFPFISTYSEYAFYPEVMWSADSSTFRVTIPPADGLETPTPPAHLWQVDAATGSASQTASIVSRFLGWPVFSPDLTNVAYLQDTGSVWDLRTARPDGSDDARYTNGEPRFIGWSTVDPQRFLYQENGATDSPVLLGTVGAMSIPLTSDVPFPLQVQWFEDGRFLFVNRSGPGWELRQGTIGGPSVVLAGMSGSSPPPYLEIAP